MDLLSMEYRAEQFAHRGTTVLETGRLVLRPFRREDAESCGRCWAGDPEVYRHLSGEAMTAEELDQWLSGAEEAYQQPDTYYWAIVERKSGQVIGEIYVDDYSANSRRCEVAWKVGRPFQGQGYGTEAALAVVRCLLKEVGFYRVQAKCSVENLASERVMPEAWNDEGGRPSRFLQGEGRTLLRRRNVRIARERRIFLREG